MAVFDNGDVVAWGNNTTGNLGDGTTTERTYPVSVADAPAKTHHYFRIPDSGYLENIKFLLSDPDSDFLTVQVESSDNAVIPYSQIFVRESSQADLIDMTAISLKELTLNLQSNAGVYGEVALTVTVWDENSQVGSSIFFVDVMASPQMTAITSQSTNEDTAIGPIAFTITDADTPVNDLTLKAFSSDEILVSNGNVTFTGSGNNRFITIEPEADQFGECTIQVIVNDGVSTAEQTITVTVMPVNDAPAFTTTVPLVAAGNQHSMIAAIDSSAWSWGNNQSGQLGIDDPLTTSSVVPEYVANTPKFEIIDAGFRDLTRNHILAVDNLGNVWGWGSNTSGQLGENPTNAEIFSPQQISTLTNVKSVAAGLEHSIALKHDGTVWTWGCNAYGQLGLGTTGGESYAPTQVTSLSNVEQIDAGGYFSMAVLDDGTVWTWGKNCYKQLGDGSGVNQNLPVQVKGPDGIGYLTDVSDISAGYYCAFALKNDDSVWGWGKGESNRLGDGNNINKLYPGQVHGVDDNGFLTDVIDIATGYSHSLAIKFDGSLVAWGKNDSGLLGIGNTSAVSVPVAVQGLTEVKFIDVGYDHSIAYQADGSVWTWGNNNVGQLGDGSTSSSYVPVQVVTPDMSDVFNIGAFLPDKIICYEEEDRLIHFSVSDAEGGIITLESSSLNDVLLPSGNIYFVTATGDHSMISLNLAAGEPQMVSLHVGSGYDEYGQGQYFIDHC
ncbi:MAG: RCC1 repeat-containing protein [Candidatus Magnetoglobus multicellularis str. Araruama]|uniref:RCC1 repeat-containing protein n=1 Tax=Candidatus Magnetoglobus multicellularis str. Araruama TaxID=890399 RepID=A0A1V1P0X0_9BACT|nr:MAG: RCC1 repeat-containing protein [Candidatus Magnetoglobus multicellularis str. Araruama]